MTDTPQTQSQPSTVDTDAEKAKQDPIDKNKLTKGEAKEYIAKKIYEDKTVYVTKTGKKVIKEK